jgi:hypothetical protein
MDDGGASMTTRPAWIEDVRATLSDSGAVRALPDGLASEPAFGPFVVALFAIAVSRRFADGVTYPEIVRFVADLRARARDPLAIDPLVTERVIARAADERWAVDPQDSRVAVAQSAVAKRIILDAGLGSEELDDLLDEAWRLAER